MPGIPRIGTQVGWANRPISLTQRGYYATSVGSTVIVYEIDFGHRTVIWKWRDGGLAEEDCPK